ncbi:hypothetical protein [Propionimicrobium sp. PCR01-08-3]|uniref:hypothetical protein n=1 Tax=Propionimicrobium sp. PCR01-08-3 TaxID=3052086 RepID=UPI00255C707E|nr:hypothetical protein [Propionimicrobium sp. PCR01-08-3]WIY82126.1 hypothetical protein QQ658_11495 [Propionimicrobium sp. PCR01-08-3]
MSRHVITATTISELLNEGTTCLQLAPGDIITALAAEEAQSKGVRVIPAANKPRGNDSGVSPQPHTQSATTPRPSEVAQALSVEDHSDNTHSDVRKAVIAALGHAPEGLDQIISKVMK